MFERFTDRARAVVVHAQDEARTLKHNYIGTEHLLLGLLDVDGGVAAKALVSLGVDVQAVRAKIEEIIGPGQRAPKGHIPFTPRAKKALELALREALQLKHDYIGTEHILLGLLREADGIAARVLVELGAGLERVRKCVLDMLEGGTPNVPIRSTATTDALTVAQQLAGDAPLGSHHLLEALADSEGSMAARVLAELGVDREAIAAKVDEIDPEQTTDATPELSAASRMELRVTGHEVHLVLRDSNTLAKARTLTEDIGGPLTAQGRLSGAFLPVWTAVEAMLTQLTASLQDEPGDEGAASRKLRRAVHHRLRRRRRP